MEFIAQIVAHQLNATIEKRNAVQWSPKKRFSE